MASQGQARSQASQGQTRSQAAREAKREAARAPIFDLMRSLQKTVQTVILSASLSNFCVRCSDRQSVELFRMVRRCLLAGCRRFAGADQATDDLIFLLIVPEFLGVFEVDLDFIAYLCSNRAVSSFAKELASDAVRVAHFYNEYSAMRDEELHIFFVSVCDALEQFSFLTDSGNLRRQCLSASLGDLRLSPTLWAKRCSISQVMKREMKQAVDDTPPAGRPAKPAPVSEFRASVEAGHSADPFSAFTGTRRGLRKASVGPSQEDRSSLPVDPEEEAAAAAEAECEASGVAAGSEVPICKQCCLPLRWMTAAYPNNGRFECDECHTTRDGNHWHCPADSADICGACRAPPVAASGSKSKPSQNHHVSWNALLNKRHVEKAGTLVLEEQVAETAATGGAGASKADSSTPVCQLCGSFFQWMTAAYPRNGAYECDECHASLDGDHWHCPADSADICGTCRPSPQAADSDDPVSSEAIACILPAEAIVCIRPPEDAKIFDHAVMDSFGLRAPHERIVLDCQLSFCDFAASGVRARRCVRARRRPRAGATQQLLARIARRSGTGAGAQFFIGDGLGSPAGSPKAEDGQQPDGGLQQFFIGGESPRAAGAGTQLEDGGPSPSEAPEAECAMEALDAISALESHWNSARTQSAHQILRCAESPTFVDSAPVCEQCGAPLKWMIAAYPRNGAYECDECHATRDGLHWHCPADSSDLCPVCRPPPKVRPSPMPRVREVSSNGSKASSPRSSLGDGSSVLQGSAARLGDDFSDDGSEPSSGHSVSGASLGDEAGTGGGPPAFGLVLEWSLKERPRLSQQAKAKRAAYQRGCCQGCRERLPPATLFEQHRYCYYVGAIFCRKCHQGDLRVIPARVAERWDFTPRKVCCVAAKFMDAQATQPAFPITRVRRTQDSSQAVLTEVHELRQQFAKMKRSENSCPFFEMLVGLSARDLEPHVTASDELYTLQDLHRLKEDGRGAQMFTQLKQLVRTSVDHILSCETCGAGRAFCLLCDHDRTQPLFAFQPEYFECGACGAVYHKKCFRRAGDECPKCLRLRAAERGPSLAPLRAR